ncbi:fimbrial protein [Serratia fonticola]|uniref:fimbrial protein n=1 Tax=Serratia fonticola TaxID=47917 RepID=UPI0021ADE0BD|nr:fimbrial protein [Serratia fonticola]
MKSRLIASILIAGVSCVSTGYANTLTCKLDKAFKGESAVVSIAGTISVGEDVPVGTVLYKASYNAAVSGGVNCVSKEKWTEPQIQIPYVRDVASTPRPIVPGVLDPAGGVVYQTNVPGIGVSVGQLPAQRSLSNIPGSEIEGGGTTSGDRMIATIQLIKTGNFDAGSVNGISFPTLKRVFTMPTGLPQHTFNGFPIQANSLSFSGQVQVVKSTCKVVNENIVVPLGNYEVDEFTGMGSYTEWKDASIKLVGCSNASPAYYSKNNSSIAITGGGTLPLGVKDVSNRITFMISPASGILDVYNGIIQLTSSSNSASGVGIQIGYNNSGATIPLRLSAVTSFTPPVMQATMQIPLFARYIQTANQVTPGVANGAVVYTINYL